MNLKEKLESLNLKLPEPTKAGGDYTPFNLRHQMAYVSIQFPILNGRPLFQGRLGATLSTEDGCKAMELCALNVLSHVHCNIGFDQVLGINHLDICYQSSGEWDDAPIVADGASSLFKKVLGEKGVHSRSLFGVHNLPRNFCAGLTASFSLVK